MAATTNGEAAAAERGEERALWAEFCEKRGRLAAQEFAQSYRVFVNSHPGSNKSFPLQEACKKFVDAFAECLEGEYRKKNGTVTLSLEGNSNKSASSNGTAQDVPSSTLPAAASFSSSSGGITPAPPPLQQSQLINTAPLVVAVPPVPETASGKSRTIPKSHDASQENLRGAVANHEDYSDLSDPEAESPRVHHRPFFRRLSFKGLKKGKSLFHKQHSDEVELSHHSHHHHHHRSNKHEKTKLAKIVVECVKEGIVNYLTGDNMDGKQKWERCRLALVKTTGGYMLEFFSPPKVSQILLL